MNIIRVVYDDDRYDYVTNEMLDNLLETNRITKFQRATGWVTVGVDPIRTGKREHTYIYPNDIRMKIAATY
jgi:hypothetical protein